MRVQAIGVKRIRGVGKESGREFDFTQLTILKPIDNASKELFSLQGYGYETSDIDVENEALNQFAHVQFPATLDLVVDTQPGRKGLRSVVVGIKAPAVKAA